MSKEKPNVGDIFMEPCSGCCYIVVKDSYNNSLRELWLHGSTIRMGTLRVDSQEVFIGNFQHLLRQIEHLIRESHKDESR